MENNYKIGLSVLIAFIFVFIILFYANESLADLSAEDKQFYSQIFDEKKKIFLYGSSHIGALNDTEINRLVSKNNPEYVIYNLATVADTPTSRISTLEKDVSLQPQMVIYGLTYRDLITDSSETNFFDIKNLENSFIYSQFPGIENLNPKLISLSAFRQLMASKEIQPEYNYGYLYLTNNPNFDNIRQEESIQNIDPLGRFEQYRPENFVFSLDNYQIQNLKKMIEVFKQNNIEFVIIINPLHRYYLDLIPIDVKNSFEETMDSISKKYDVKIYDLSEKYAELPIWRNWDHVAYNQTALIFTEDVSKIIIKEIES